MVRYIVLIVVSLLISLAIISSGMCILDIPTSIGVVRGIGGLIILAIGFKLFESTANNFVDRIISHLWEGGIKMNSVFQPVKVAGVKPVVPDVQNMVATNFMPAVVKPGHLSLPPEAAQMIPKLVSELSSGKSVINYGEGTTVKISQFAEEGKQYRANATTRFEELKQSLNVNVVQRGVS